jgi:hypothetical protein
MLYELYYKNSFAVGFIATDFTDAQTEITAVEDPPH